MIGRSAYGRWGNIKHTKMTHLLELQAGEMRKA
jgi:hypothetical protein